MKKFLTMIFNVVAVLIVFALVFGIGFLVGLKSGETEQNVVNKDSNNPIDMKLPGETEKRVITVKDVESKLAEVQELSTYSGEYTITLGKEETRYFLDDIQVPGTNNSIEITCSGIVKVGYDMSEILVKVDDDKIYISLPEAKLNDNYVIWDSVEYKEENNILNPIEFSQYQEIVSEIEIIGLEDVESRGIYNSAEVNLKKVIEAFLSEFSEYEIIYM